MSVWRALAVVVPALAAASCTMPGPQAVLSKPDLLRPSDLDSIAQSVNAEIQIRHLPGAVVLIGTRERVLYRQAFGNRVLGEQPEAMTADAIFDLASLTKVVATTVAVMQLTESGRLDLDAPVARYWPEFRADGKDAIRVRDLLVHYSGLKPDLDLSREWRGYDTAMAMILEEKAIAAPGERYIYSDLNFEILGELVRRVSGSPLDRYCHDHVFAPLGMNDTLFLPPASLRGRVVPTEDSRGLLHWGEVHDATARWMGGVAGHAGVFSTADDLSIFARMMLGGGQVGNVRILDARSVDEMTSRQSPPAGTHARGYGWDLGGPDGDPFFPPGSYGHLGFTGTMIWIDPSADLYAIVLTHRVYPDGTGDAGPLRKAILQILAEAIDRQAPKN